MSEYERIKKNFEVQVSENQEGTEENNEAKLYIYFLKKLKNLVFNESNAKKSNTQLLSILKCEKQERCGTNNYKEYRKAVDEVLESHLNYHVENDITGIAKEAYVLLSILVKKDDNDDEKYVFPADTLSADNVTNAEFEKEYDELFESAKNSKKEPPSILKSVLGLKK